MNTPQERAEELYELTADSDFTEAIMSEMGELLELLEVSVDELLALGKQTAIRVYASFPEEVIDAGLSFYGSDEGRQFLEASREIVLQAKAATQQLIEDNLAELEESGSNTDESTSKWTLEGYDTFSDESYSLEGEYDSRKDAELVAMGRLVELERTQPTESSGGQKEDGIQDRVFIVAPDGNKERYTG